MTLSIDKIILMNFKGIKYEDIPFCEKTVAICGANGTGKSSIECAYFWLMADCSETLTSNPAIFPLNVEAASPSVVVIADVDGRKITLERVLNRSIKKSKREGEADAVTFSSTYKVNTVEYGLRDFKNKIAEYGITDRFLTLSHPDMFLSSKKDEMRKILFGMSKDLTDLEVAEKTEGADDLATLLKDYTLEEVTSMQNSTIRKIKEEYGANGEILRAKIEGLELSKVDIDFAELELQKSAIKEQIEKNQDAQRVANLILADLDKIKDKQLSLQFELSGLEQKAKTDKEEQEKKLFIEKRELDEKATDLDRQIAHMKAEVTIYEDSFKHSETEKKRFEEILAKAQAMVFDVSQTICPVCHRVYEQSKVDEIKAEFEKQKMVTIGNAENDIKSNRSMLAIKKSEKADLDRRLEKAINDRAELQRALDKACSASEITINTYDDEISRLKAEIEKNKSVMDEKQSGLPNMAVLKAEELNLNTQLRETEIQLSKADDNNRIDSQIDNLREQQIQYEQNKANAEKILYEISLVSKRKNELLTDEINSHFKLVKFKFFDYLKNGSYKECCIPTVDGKEFGAALNNAMQIRAKIDICVSLQKFYNEYYPVWVDNSEALDTDNQAQIKYDTQIVMLRVTDDKQLTIKEA